MSNPFKDGSWETEVGRSDNIDGRLKNTATK